MHHLGLVRPRGPRSLEKSRLDLQEWLHRTHCARISNVTLVFDGRLAHAGDENARSDHGLRVLFSSGEPADDLIEELIKRQAQPQRLTVVSSDRRIQER